MRFHAIVLLALFVAACEDRKVEEAKGTPSASAVSIATPPASTSAPPPKAEPPPTSVAAQHVLVAYKGAKDAPKTVTRSRADARKRADEVATKAKGGADFSALVAEYSDDPAAKERQGSVGKFTREKMVAPFSDAAFALKVGETSDVVETPFGFHVIKRNQ